MHLRHLITLILTIMLCKCGYSDLVLDLPEVFTSAREIERIDAGKRLLSVFLVFIVV